MNDEQKLLAWLDEQIAGCRSLRDKEGPYTYWDKAKFWNGQIEAYEAVKSYLEAHQHD